MKRTIRIGSFETNSSSAHAFVVFDDPSILNEWMNNSDVFLFLYDSPWVSNHEVDRWTVFNEEYVTEVDRNMLIYRGSDEYQQACRTVINEEQAYAFAWGDDEDFNDDGTVSDSLLAGYGIIAYHTLVGRSSESDGWFREDGAYFGYGTDNEGHVSEVDGRPLYMIGNYSESLAAF